MNEETENTLADRIAFHDELEDNAYHRGLIMGCVVATASMLPPILIIAWVVFRT